ncbi:hypothetical protein VTO73DRAFT_10313 [Trametes versicolor]
MTSEISPVASAFGALYRNPRVGDLIIRTADEVDFHVYKAIIAAASVVFTDMLSIPQPSPATTGDSDKPSVDVAESSVVWETLIMLCYAPRPPTPEDFEDLDAVRAILDAGVKYRMDVAVEYARLGLLLPRFVKEKPFVVYALGCAYKLPDVTRAAARHSLRFPIYFEYSKELDLLSPRAFHHLFEYRRECGAVAQMIVARVHSDSSSLLPATRAPTRHQASYSPKRLPDCVPFEHRGCSEKACIAHSGSTTNTFTARATFKKRVQAERYFQELRTKLEFLPDASLALSEPLLQTMIDVASDCSTCFSTVHSRVAEFSKLLYAAIEDAISHAELVVDE